MKDDWVAIIVLVLLEATTIGQSYLSGDVRLPMLPRSNFVLNSQKMLKVLNAIGGILGYIVITVLVVFEEDTNGVVKRQKIDFLCPFQLLL